MAPHRLDWDAQAWRRIIWERGVYDRRSDVHKDDEYLSAASADKLSTANPNKESASAPESRPPGVPRPEGWSTDSFTLTLEIEAKRLIRLTYRFTSVAPGHKQAIPEMATRLLTHDARTFFLKFQAFLLRDYYLHGGERRETPEEFSYSTELRPRLKPKHKPSAGDRPTGPSQ